MLAPRLMMARSQREAFRLRGEHASLEVLADRRSQETVFVVENILSVLKPGLRDHILDIGCGDGALLNSLTRRVARCAGIDLSPVGLAKLRAHLTMPAKTLLSAGISEALPFRNAAFSMVVINSVLYALASYEEAERTIAEVRRVLAPAGIAYFGEVPTADERKGARPRNSYSGKILAKLKRHGMRAILQRLWERRHEAVQIIAPDTFLYWSPDAFTMLLNKHGFLVTQVLPHRSLTGPTSRLNYVAACVNRPS